MGAVQPIVVPQSLAYVLNNAGEKSNVDFSYLVDTAQRESALNPNAKASGSSATGLFQFLDSSWLQVMKEEGPRLGYQKYADAITTDKNGDYVIKDKALRTKILALRQDPQVAADMAAAYTQSNGDYLKGKFGRMPSPGELYIAHFLGPQGAEKLFKAGLDNPDQVAAKLFPNQAKANPQIFYQDGHSRTIREVYKALVSKHDGIVATTASTAADAPDPKFSTHLLASGDAASKWSTEAVPSRFTKADMSFTSLFATEKPSGVTAPLIGAEAAQPLIDGYGQQAVSLVPPTPYPAPARPAADPGQPLALMSPDQVIPPEPLQAIDNAMSGAPDDGGGDDTASIGDPFDAPTPLMGGDNAAAATAPLALMADGSTDPAPATATDLGMAADPMPQLQPDDGLPRGRVLMSPGAHQPNAAFFTQLLTQTRF